MRVLLALVFSAAVLVALAPSVAGAQGVTYDPASEWYRPGSDWVGASPIVGLVAWDKGGSADWGSGIPSPTIDCAAVGTSSAASLQCSGATPSFAGPGQAAAGSPWWYRGDTAVRPAIALNGITDYWNLGDVGRSSDTYAWCFQAFRASSATSATVFGRRSAGVVGVSVQFLTGGGISFAIFKSGASATVLNSTATVPVGAWATVCGSYRFVADGTSEMRVNINGTAEAITNAVGPAYDTATNAQIGRLGSYNDLLPGGIRRVAIWTGADAPTSAAQLAQLVATQWGLAADKPAGTVATHARTDSTLCCPFTDAECYTVGPGAPCIHAPSYVGWAGTGPGIEVYGAGSNLLATSVDIGSWVTWSPGHIAPVRTSNTTETTDPRGGNTAAKVVFPAVAAGQISLLVSPQFAQTATPYAFGLWAKVPSGTWRTYLSCYSTGYYAIREVTITPTWQRLSTTGTSPGSATQSCSIGTDLNAPAPGEAATDAGTVYLWAGQANAGRELLPYRPTTGTAYTGTASTATALTVPLGLTDPTRGLVLVSASAGTWTLKDRYLLGATGHALRAYTNGTLYLYLDGNATPVTSWASGGLTGEHRVGLAWTGATAGICADGSVVAQGASTFSAPSAWSIGYGQQPGGGSAYFDGLVSRVVQYRRAGSCR